MKTITYRAVLLPIFLLAIFTSMSYGQQYEQLERIGKYESIPNDKGIIYGNFIQRLGFTSGGFQQDIRVINLDSGEIFTFSVKPAIKSSKENPFIYFIKAGRYAILNYQWIASKWYGGKIFVEPIYKNRVIELTSQSEQDDHTIANARYTFTVSPNTVNYVGTWHFDNENVAFTTDKESIDKKILSSNKKKFDFDRAVIALPR